MSISTYSIKKVPNEYKKYFKKMESFKTKTDGDDCIVHEGIKLNSIDDAYVVQFCKLYNVNETIEIFEACKEGKMDKFINDANDESNKDLYDVFQFHKIDKKYDLKDEYKEKFKDSSIYSITLKIKDDFYQIIFVDDDEK